MPVHIHLVIIVRNSPDVVGYPVDLVDPDTKSPDLDPRWDPTRSELYLSPQFVNVS